MMTMQMETNPQPLPLLPLPQRTSSSSQQAPPEHHHRHSSPTPTTLTQNQRLLVSSLSSGKQQQQQPASESITPLPHSYSSFEEDQHHEDLSDSSNSTSYLYHHRLRLQELQLEPQPEDRKQQQQQEQQHWHQGYLSSNDHSNNSSGCSDTESQFCLSKAYNSGSRASGSGPTYHHDVLHFSKLQRPQCREPLENSSTIERVDGQRKLVQHLRHDQLSSSSSSILSAPPDPPSFPRENQRPPSSSFTPAILLLLPPPPLCMDEEEVVDHSPFAPEATAAPTSPAAAKVGVDALLMKPTVQVQQQRHQGFMPADEEEQPRPPYPSLLFSGTANTSNTTPAAAVAAGTTTNTSTRSAVSATTIGDAKTSTLSITKPPPKPEHLLMKPTCVGTVATTSTTNINNAATPPNVARQQHDHLVGRLPQQPLNPKQSRIRTKHQQNQQPRHHSHHQGGGTCCPGLEETTRPVVSVPPSTATTTRTPTTTTTKPKIARARSGTTVDHPVDLTWFDGEEEEGDENDISSRPLPLLAPAVDALMPEKEATHNGGSSTTASSLPSTLNPNYSKDSSSVPYPPLYPWQQPTNGDRSDDEKDLTRSQQQAQHQPVEQEFLLLDLAQRRRRIWSLKQKRDVQNGKNTTNYKTADSPTAVASAPPTAVEIEKTPTQQAKPPEAGDNDAALDTRSSLPVVETVASKLPATVSEATRSVPPSAHNSSSKRINSTNNCDNRQLASASKTPSITSSKQQQSVSATSSALVHADATEPSPQHTQQRASASHKRSQTLSDAPCSDLSDPPLSPQTPTLHHPAKTSSPAPRQHQLYHPYSRPSLLRSPQRRSSETYASSANDGSPRTQRSSSIFMPWPQPSSTLHTGSSLSSKVVPREKSVYQKLVELRQRPRQNKDDTAEDCAVASGISANKQSHRKVLPELTDDKKKHSSNHDEGSDDDASSMDSEALLELWASKIRSELRLEAILEMASEAERAAESGQESFSLSRPWAYHEVEKDKESGNSPPPPAGSLQRLGLRRNSTYSEGFTPQFLSSGASGNKDALGGPSRNLLMYGSTTTATPGLAMATLLLRRQPHPPKLPVQELRSVDEVFPQLDSLHKHLRTHFARNHIREDCLFFDEEDEATEEASRLTEIVGHNKGGCETSGAATHRNIHNAARIQSLRASRLAATEQDTTSSVTTSPSFLHSFNFDLLGNAAVAGASAMRCPSRLSKDAKNETVDDSSDDDDDDSKSCGAGMGDLLSNHLSIAMKKHPPKRVILSGMEAVVDQQHRLMVAASRMKVQSSTSAAAPVSGYFNSDSTPPRGEINEKSKNDCNNQEICLMTTPTQQTRGQSTEEANSRASPRTNDKSNRGMAGSISEWNNIFDYSPGIIETPAAHSDEWTSSSFEIRDFVTPAKLRKIRDEQERGGDGDGTASIPLPVLSNVSRVCGGNGTVNSASIHQEKAILPYNNSLLFLSPSATAVSASSNTTAVMTPSLPKNDTAPSELLLPTLPNVVGSKEMRRQNFSSRPTTSPNFLRPSLASTGNRGGRLLKRQHQSSKEELDRQIPTPAVSRHNHGPQVTVVSHGSGSEHMSSLDRLEEQRGQHSLASGEGSSTEVASTRGKLSLNAEAGADESEILGITDLSADNDSVDENGSHMQNESELPHTNDGTPQLRQACSCLSLSPSESVDDFEKAGLEHPLVVIDEPSHCLTPKRRAEPFATAMKMLSRLSTRRAEAGVAAAAATKAERLRQQQQERRRRRALYVGTQENEEFMRNFLYCGKQRLPPSDIMGVGIGTGRKQGAGRPCQDDPFCETNLLSAMANQCYAALVLDPEGPASFQTDDARQDTALCSTGAASVVAPRLPTAVHTKDSSLFRSSSSLPKLEPETWFDVATEKVDTVIESLVGSTPPQNDWRQSFEPPSLRKVDSAPTLAKSSAATTNSAWQPPHDKPYSLSAHKLHHPLQFRRWTGGRPLDSTLEEKTSSDNLLNATSPLVFPTRSTNSAREEKEGEEKTTYVSRPQHNNNDMDLQLRPTEDVYSPSIISLLSRAPDGDLDDAQFRLVYGMTREERYGRLEDRRNQHEQQKSDLRARRNQLSWKAHEKHPYEEEDYQQNRLDFWNHRHDSLNGEGSEHDDEDNDQYLNLYHSISLQDHRRTWLGTAATVVTTPSSGQPLPPQVSVSPGSQAIRPILRMRAWGSTGHAASLIHLPQLPLDDDDDENNNDENKQTQGLQPLHHQ